jgi:hypothetical protein
LIIIFASYYANICFFYHSHVINGATIVHSHFYNKTHAQTGTHGEKEITLIPALSTFQSLQPAVYVIGVGNFFLFQAFILPSFEKRNPSAPIAGISLRAPPALSEHTSG